MHLHSTDDVMAEHARRSAPDECPLLHQFMAMDMEERWLTRSPRAMLETFHWFQGECFDSIVEDLLEIPAGRPVIAEGFRLLPHLVAPLLLVSRRAVWLLPTPEFRRAAVERRGGCGRGFLARTSHPEKALQNLLERDRMFTDRLRKEVERLELSSIDVNAAMTEQDSLTQVRRAFDL